MKMPQKKTQTMWVVVLVESGIPVAVEAYRDQRTAQKRERLLRNDMREEYDAVGMFEVEVAQ